METKRIIALAVLVVLASAVVATVGASAHETTETTTGEDETTTARDDESTETTTAGDGATHGNQTGEMDGQMRMQMVEDGLVVNANADALPAGCTELDGTTRVTIAAGREFAAPGNMFSYDAERIRVPSCTKVVVTFVNRDHVRHQWMLHGLPKATYPMGMFMVTAEANSTVTGTFVTPAGNQTLDTHCSLPQHEQKGMYMEVVIGNGSADSRSGTSHHGQSGTTHHGHDGTSQHDHSGTPRHDGASHDPAAPWQRVRFPAVLVAGFVVGALGVVLGYRQRT